jgi:hypothetical protein
MIARVNDAQLRCIPGPGGELHAVDPARRT